MRHLALVCILLFAFALISGCQILLPGEPASYESLCGLSREQFSEMDETQVHAWLKDKYKIWMVQINHETDQSKDLAGFTAKIATGESTAVSLHKNRISFILTEHPTAEKTFGQVVAGLGIPESIYLDEYKPMAYEGKAIYTIGLNYPALGISVYYTSWCGIGDCALNIRSVNGSSRVQLQKQIPVNWIECY